MTWEDFGLPTRALQLTLKYFIMLLKTGHVASLDLKGGSVLPLMCWSIGYHS